MISVVALLYGIVVCIATFLGAFVGLGGGVVIKPVLDVIGASIGADQFYFLLCGVCYVYHVDGKAYSE